MSNSKTPEWFNAWRDVGFIRPETAKKWLISGFKPETASPWYHLDDVEIQVATDWARHGFSAEEYSRWVHCGFKTATGASVWRKWFSDPAEAYRWRAYGLRADGRFVEMLEDGVPPAVIAHAQRIGVEADVQQITTWVQEIGHENIQSSDDLRMWMSSGLEPREVLYWISRGATISIVAGFRRAGWCISDLQLLMEEWGDRFSQLSFWETHVTPEIVLGWKWRGISTEEALNWIRLKVSSDNAALWMGSGINEAADRKWWLDHNLGLQDALELGQAGWDFPREFDKRRMPSWGPKDIVQFLRVGVSRDEIIAWIDENPMGFHRWLRFLEATVRSGNLAKWRSSAIDSADWPLWIDQISQSPTICEQWMSTGLTPEQIVVRLRQSESQADDFSIALTGENLLSEVDRRAEEVARKRTLLAKQRAEEARLRSAQANTQADAKPPDKSTTIATEAIVRGRISDDDLVKFQEWAVFLSNRIRKSPIQGMEFNDEKNGLAIRIVDVDAVIQMEVVLDGKRHILRIDSFNFDALSPLRSNGARAAYVLAISWFMDCAVVLKSGRARTSTNFHQSGESSPRAQSVRLRYLPTMRFSDAVRGVKSGDGIARVTHDVAGHIRHLPMGHKPSGEAVGRAPAFLRRKMGPRDTYVVEHTRGQESKVEEIVNKLSKYSMTAHAVASLSP